MNHNNLRSQLAAIGKTGIDPETYIFPGEFARCMTQTGTVEHPPLYVVDTPNMEYCMDKPLTMKTLMESHIATGGRFLLNKDSHTLPLLAKAYCDTLTWDVDPIIIDDKKILSFTKLLNTETLRYLGDRIQYMPKFIQTGDYKSLGLKASELFKPFIDVIEKCGGIPYRDTINFLANAFILSTHRDPLWGWGGPYKLSVIPKEENRAFTSATGFRQLTAGYVIGNSDKSMILIALLFVYFTQYQGWINDRSVVKVNGKDIFVSHHSVLQNIVNTLAYRGHVSDTDSYSPLPFGTHPSVFYKSLIEIIAETTLKEIEDTHYPTDEIYDLDIQDPNCHQLLTGVGLYNEGALMKHCIGGEEYREMMDEGVGLFFHFNTFCGTKCGATLALASAGDGASVSETGSAYESCYIFIDKYKRQWQISEFYGYDNEELRSDEQVEELLSWLGRHFKTIDLRNIIYRRYYGSRIEVRELRRKFLTLKTRHECKLCPPAFSSIDGIFRW